MAQSGLRENSAGTGLRSGTYCETSCAAACKWNSVRPDVWPEAAAERMPGTTAAPGSKGTSMSAVRMGRSRIDKWQKDTHDLNALAAELGMQVEAVNGGDLRRAEGLLIAQAHTLDNIFANLARRATGQQYLAQWEAFMPVAMKAQNQCRMTLETLATITSPPVVFARQANINNGGQHQVNNGPAPATRPSAAHAAKPAAAPYELLEAEHGQRLDTRTPGTTSSADPRLAALEAVNRTADTRRQSALGSQRVQRRAQSRSEGADTGNSRTPARPR